MTVWVALKRAVGFLTVIRTCLSSEAVQSASLSFQRVHDVHGGDGLSLGVLCVSNGITNDVLQEHLQHTAGLLVDQTGNTLDSTAASETTNSGFGDGPGCYPAGLYGDDLAPPFPSPLPPLPLPRHVYYTIYYWRTRICENNWREAVYICLRDLTETKPRVTWRTPSHR